jgi:hypothetical protein
MTNLTLASAKDIKVLVENGTVAHVDAIARVDAVLTRNTLAPGKKARWTRLREWLVKAQETA